jgi:hypothetical protein
MITRISSVIRPKGSDLIFDHPYNAEYELLKARPTVWVVACRSASSGRPGPAPGSTAGGAGVVLDCLLGIEPEDARWVGAMRSCPWLFVLGS